MTATLAFIILVGGCSLFLLAITVGMLRGEFVRAKIEETSFDKELYEKQNLSFEAWANSEKENTYV